MDDLYLQHGLEIFITVVAYNAAGLHTTVRSKPVTVDKTPPVLCCVHVDYGGHTNVPYLTSEEVVLKWKVDDPETGLKQCQYGIGRSSFIQGSSF